MHLNHATRAAMLTIGRSGEGGRTMVDPPTEPVGQPERSGEDSRRRGWFWHWNTIITQFAPLIGLKGVGLLNSYTVWTDRREHSPYRGYAFPSQQAEAAFYGEDRGELITINKILVALDLVEIRKEMVTRTDEAGRRWRVPHNFYRVKDRPEGFVLTPEAVLRVVELAARDDAVYRYIRHIFSPRFAPIDRDNVWHRILPVVRQHPIWQALAARAAAEDARFSARTRAGHARRKAAALNPASPEETSVAPCDGGSPTVVAASNSGSPADVAPSDTGRVPDDPTFVGPTNREEASSVAPTDRTYDQAAATTTTTTALLPEDAPPSDGAGPLLEPSPEVVACYEAANARPASPLERDLLAELEREFAPLAEARGERPAELVVAAIREAVASGSRYVAPKRVREILARWSRHAVRSSPPRGRGLSEHRVVSLETTAVPDSTAELPPAALDRLVSLLEAALLSRLAQGSAPAAAAPPADEPAVAPPEADEPPSSLAPLWSLAQEHLGERLPSAAFAECIRPARVLAVPAPDEVVLGVPNGSVRQKLVRRWLPEVREVLATLLGRPVEVRVVTFAEWRRSDAAP
ncbi:MAG: hypothetical protein RMK01_08875 [Thermomicrobium sp.]|nr:hypothetical protein [Thermomicrobium sp.]MDW8060173.1 hypothetical protein [Thermomicrobium sp.]